MDPSNIPFKALIVGPTKSGKSRFIVQQITGPFRFKFSNIVLICPTFLTNKTFFRFGEKDPRFYVYVCKQNQVEMWLRLAQWLFDGTNTLIILDDCASSKDIKGRANALVELGFHGRHSMLSVWVVTQHLARVSLSFRQNPGAAVVFYSPSADSMKAAFDQFGFGYSHKEFKELVNRLKEKKHSYLVFFQRSPFFCFFAYCRII